MNRKLILLNIVLLVLAGWFSWQLRLKWVELHQHEHTVLALSPAVKKRLAPPVPLPMFKPMAAMDYNAAVQNNLFAKDRNPNVIVDPPPPPKPPPPPPPMPELPSYYGSMNFGDPVVMLKLPKGEQKRYHAGEKVGPFKLVSFDQEKLVFEWDGKTVERKPGELKEKASSAAASAASAPGSGELLPNPPPPLVQPGADNSGARRIGGSASASDEPKVSEKIGKDNGGGIRMCVPGDTSPAGTIIDGYKKKITTNMFGQTCMWEQVNP